MSNDGTPTPEPGREPDDRAWPAPAPSGYEASGGTGPAPSGYEVPTGTGADTPTQAFPRPQDAPTQAFPSATGGPQDAPTQAYPVPGQPTVAFPAPGTGSAPQAPAGSAWPSAPGSGSGSGEGGADRPADPYAVGGTGQGAPAPGPYGPPQPGYPQPGAQQPGYPQPGYPQPGAGQGTGGPGYPPPPGGAPYGAAPYGQYPGPAAGPRTDGVSIAALVTGILGTGVIAIVLGVIGLRRTKRDGSQGKGFAIAGIVLGGLGILATIAIGLTVFFAAQAHGNRIDALHDACAAGEWSACTDLYQESVIGSDEEEFGSTCGGRTDGTVSCTNFEDGFTYGDSAELDALWDACESGDGASCDTLYSSAPRGSEYEEFGGTCAGRGDGTTYCAEDSGALDGLEDLLPEEGDDAGTATGSGATYGSDPALDALYDACAAGDGTACDDLYWSSPLGSEYEQFGTTCGGRVESAFSCEEELAAG